MAPSAEIVPSADTKSPQPLSESSESNDALAKSGDLKEVNITQEKTTDVGNDLASSDAPNNSTAADSTDSNTESPPENDPNISEIQVASN